MAAVVETSNGRVRGATRRGALAFMGIPYARAAVGRLRFAAPRPPEPWPGVRDCFEPGPGAPQRSSMPSWLQGLAGNPRLTGEDCLRVHVFTPSLEPAKRPVLVWIHGGGFVFGSGSAPVYDGVQLAREHDVVVITLNYRLGALGFAQLDSVARGGPFASNVGLRDQLAALAWVRQNVAAFGGDAGNVTVFGESAGAMSIGALLGSPLARGLFQRAICQSGAAHHVSSRDGAARMAHALLRAQGLTSANAERLCDVPLGALVDAQIRAAASVPAPWGLLPWQPAQGDDVLPRPPLDAIMLTGYYYTDDTHQALLRHPELKTREERERESDPESEESDESEREDTDELLSEDDCELDEESKEEEDASDSLVVLYEPLYVSLLPRFPFFLLRISSSL